MEEIKAAGSGKIPHGDKLAVSVDLDQYQQAVSKVRRARRLLPRSIPARSGTYTQTTSWS